MTKEKEDQVKKDFATLINKHSLENESNTPDFILADYLFQSLRSFNAAARRRDNWYGGKLSIVDSEKVEKWEPM